jgi:hypothetical protein
MTADHAMPMALNLGASSKADPIPTKAAVKFTRLN